MEDSSGIIVDNEKELLIDEAEVGTKKEKLKFNKTKNRETVSRINEIRFQFLYFWNWILETRNFDGLGDEENPFIVSQDIYTRLQKLFTEGYNINKRGKPRESNII
eukprot:NODE_500_length_7578_cov_0.067790.p5 type:complete len:106 gc:universal NODE_500_length_7578_cov_0.067790:1416-1099(-)